MWLGTESRFSHVLGPHISRIADCRTQVMRIGDCTDVAGAISQAPPASRRRRGVSGRAAIGSAETASCVTVWEAGTLNFGLTLVQCRCIAARLLDRFLTCTEQDSQSQPMIPDTNPQRDKRRLCSHVRLVSWQPWSKLW